MGTNLGGDDKVILLPAELLNGLSQKYFCLAKGVVLRCIKEVDASIICSFQTSKSPLCLDLAEIIISLSVENYLRLRARRMLSSFLS